MDGLQAAVLNVKMGRLEAWNREQREIARRYSEALAGAGEWTLPAEKSGCTHVYHLYVIRHPRRDALREHLGRLGIGTQLNYPRALPCTPAYARLGHRPAFRRGAILAYAVLAGCVLILMRTAHLDGYWATLTLVMLIGYFAAPRAIFRLCHVTHAGGPVIPHSINNKEKIP